MAALQRRISPERISNRRLFIFLQTTLATVSSSLRKCPKRSAKCL